MPSDRDFDIEHRLTDLEASREVDKDRIEELELRQKYYDKAGYFLMGAAGFSALVGMTADKLKEKVMQFVHGIFQ